MIQSDQPHPEIGELYAYSRLRSGPRGITGTMTHLNAFRPRYEQLGDMLDQPEPGRPEENRKRVEDDCRSERKPDQRPYVR